MSCTERFVRRNHERRQLLIYKLPKTMSTESKTSDYMLLFRGTDWHKGLSPEQIQRVTGEWMSWFERLTNEGKATAGHPLEPQGRVVTGKKCRAVVADGPFAEAKEMVGGYFLL